MFTVFGSKMLDTDVILIIFDVNKIQNSSKFLLLGKFFEIKTVSQKLSSLINEKIQKKRQTTDPFISPIRQKIIKMSRNFQN